MIEPLKTTPLHASHLDLKAKMAAFAGYDMPIHYAEGVLAEHNWTRASCGLFDVSHMGQVTARGGKAAALWEKLTPSAIAALPVDACKYTVMTNVQGGIIDDLIVTRFADDEFFAVINAGCKEKDILWIQSNLPDGVRFDHLEQRALLAIQGPQSENVLRDVTGFDASSLGYMRVHRREELMIFRLGYTGEDGFEISVPAHEAQALWSRLIDHPAVKPVGLAARDSLRLDMGYPLYGHDIDTQTSPLEADLGWVMGKSRIDYVGADIVDKQRGEGVSRRRVGVRLTGKGIAREGAELFSGDGGRKIGVLTSGGFSPTLGEAIGQGYVETAHAETGAEIIVRVRGRDIAAVLAPLPFVPAKTKRPTMPRAA